jgi:hypothetical protein
VHKVSKELKAFKEQQAFKVLLELRDLLAPAFKEFRASKEPPAFKVLLELRDLLEPDFRELKVFKAFRD